MVMLRERFFYPTLTRIMDLLENSMQAKQFLCFTTAESRAKIWSVKYTLRR